MSIEKVEAALTALREGDFVVVTDDASRENEADLVLPAQRATPEALAFMVRHTSGLVCVGMSRARLSELNLPLMVSENSESHETAFTVSVDYRRGTSTGISAHDRSVTIRALADAATGPGDFARPGHVFPLRAQEGGVLRRRGHTEAALDLARLSGYAPAGALCELVREDGSMLRPAQITGFAEQFRLPVLSIAELAAYRRVRESLVEHVAEARLPTRQGVFTAHVYRSRIDGQEHVALVKGDVCGASDVLVRVHSECFTGDVLGSVRCDCREQLEAALATVAAAGQGVVVYLRGHEGRGIGLASKLHAYALQDRGRDTVEANLDLGLPVDSRTYDVGAQILRDLGVTTLRLMSNNPAKFTELEGYRLQIVERVPLLTQPNAENVAYLRTKQLKLGHQLGVSGPAAEDALTEPRVLPAVQLG